MPKSKTANLTPRQKSQLIANPPAWMRPAVDPLSIDYSKEPEKYRILTGEKNVFKTNPYSAEMKPLWRFKDEATAKKSADDLNDGNWVAMDIARKFVQMGYTRSTRYSLRPGGVKYSKETGQEIPRTGKIADEGKFKGAQLFKATWEMIEHDEVYKAGKERWKIEVEGKQPDKPKAKPRREEGVEAQSKEQGKTRRRAGSED